MLYSNEFIPSLTYSCRGFYFVTLKPNLCQTIIYDER